MSSEALRPRQTQERSDRSPPASIRAWLPPVERREFWAIQALVVFIAAVHFLVEREHLLGERSPLYLLPTTLYLIPCVYAAVKFGSRGAALTAMWSAIFVSLSLLVSHEGLAAIGELAQVAWISLAAVFVGSRVDRERAARHEAEGREAARRASERRYRTIMDNVDEPIILLGEGGQVIEANESAADLLGRSVDELKGTILPGPAGASISEWLDTAVLDRTRSVPMRLGQPARWFELVRLTTVGRSGDKEVQLLLRDVTTSYEREQGLESITREAIATREEEQQRIARELHDGPVQSLVQLWRTLDSLADEAPEPQRARVVVAREVAENVADELRRFSRDLRPSVLDDLGISAAIRSEAESLGQRAGMSVSVRVVGTAQRLNEDVELALLRITQEAVRNIERHSQASKVTILLEFDRMRVRLTISDDGIGLDPVPTVSELLCESRLGLIGMQERARLVGGQFEMQAQEGGGLTATANIPIHEIPHR
ncbi:MAG: histidine kinase [Chloroflexota bacterium]